MKQIQETFKGIEKYNHEGKDKHIQGAIFLERFTAAIRGLDLEEEAVVAELEQLVDLNETIADGYDIELNQKLYDVFLVLLEGVALNIVRASPNDGRKGFIALVNKIHSTHEGEISILQSRIKNFKIDSSSDPTKSIAKLQELQRDLHNIVPYDERLKLSELKSALGDEYSVVKVVNAGANMDAFISEVENHWIYNLRKPNSRASAAAVGGFKGKGGKGPFRGKGDKGGSYKGSGKGYSKGKGSKGEKGKGGKGHKGFKGKGDKGGKGHAPYSQYRSSNRGTAGGINGYCYTCGEWGHPWWGCTASVGGYTESDTWREQTPTEQEPRTQNTSAVSQERNSSTASMRATTTDDPVGALIEGVHYDLSV
jgi:hypothetical protein